MVSNSAKVTLEESKKKVQAKMWLKILRQNIIQLAWRNKGSTSIDQKTGGTKNIKSNSNGTEVSSNEDHSTDLKNQGKKKSGAGNGPLLQHAEVSSSQLDFFRMLDEKIENGPDYDETMDATTRAERMSDLLRRWELAGTTFSSTTDLNNPMDTIELLNCTRRNLSAKDREGMRNIIGGRPESAPVFTRSANCVDGIDDVQCPSPNMPRHVLESISQSPTQMCKKLSTPPGTSPTSLHFHDYKELNTSKNMQLKNYNHNTNKQNYDYLNQQAIYREQYLQQTGIITVQPQYQNANLLKNNSYVQQFQIANGQQNFNGRKRGFNPVELT